MWYQNRFFKYATAIILVLLIVLLLNLTEFLFKPIINFFAALFFPVLFAGILYYVFRPVVRFLEKMRVPRWLAILLTYVFAVVAVTTLSAYVGPILVEQVNKISDSVPPEKIEQVKEKTVSLMKYFDLQNYSTEELRTMVTTYLQKLYELISNNIVATVSSITRFAMWLFITPFILYYLLKDDDAAEGVWLKIVPDKYQKQTREVFNDIDYVLSSFISGQLMVASSLGFLLFIGYLIIGLDNAFILALFATLCITIPIFGSFLALIPALLVGFSMAPWMGVKVLIVMLVAQILESNFVSPQIMGKRLNIHPLVLMLILLASGSLYGILGLFLATPVYAVLRVLAGHLYDFYNVKSKARKSVARDVVKDV